MLELNNVYNMDCIEGMKQLLKQGIKVDCIITDPPYNISVEGKVLKRDKPNCKTSRKTSIKFDFGEWDRMDNKEYEKFIEEFVELSTQLLKPGGAVLCWFAKEKISWLADLFTKNGIKNKTILTWHKTNPTPQFRITNYLSASEFCYYGIKEGGQYTFNFTKQTDMHNVIDYPNASIYGETDHPTEKPLYIINKLVNIHTNKGDVVLDCFMGSCTTAVSCHRLQRKFIGFEKDKHNFEVGTARLKKAQSQLSIFDMEGNL